MRYAKVMPFRVHLNGNIIGFLPRKINVKVRLMNY